MKLSEVMFLDSEVVTNTASRGTKGDILLRDEYFTVQSWLCELLPQAYALRLIKQCGERGNGNMVSLTLRDFDLKNGVSNCFPDFYEDLKEIVECKKQKTVALSSKCKLDFTPVLHIGQTAQT